MFPCLSLFVLLILFLAVRTYKCAKLGQATETIIGIMLMIGVGIGGALGFCLAWSIWG